MRIAVSNDHAGFPLKPAVLERVAMLGHDVIDLGTQDDREVDFPVMAQRVADAIVRGESDRGVLVCGSGVGAAIAANKVRGIRAAVIHDVFLARQGVEHDDVNVACLGAWVVGRAIADDVIAAFLAAEFGDGEAVRRRVAQLDELDRARDRAGAASVRAFGGAIPDVVACTWVAPNATLIGRFEGGRDSSIWFSAIVRADGDDISLGAESNLQDGVVVHADPGFPCTVGERVSVGHAAVLHGCSIGDDCLVGMGATVLNGAVIGAGSLVAAGSVVLEGTVIPPGSLVAGVPAKVRRELTEDEVRGIRRNSRVYVELARRYAGGQPTT